MALLTATICVAAPEAVATRQSQQLRPPTKVTVAITRNGYTLSTRKLRLGQAVFTVVNKDPYFGHDFAILGNGSRTFLGKTRALAPHQRAILRVRFTRPGRYTYISSLHDQIELGYRGVLTVQ